MDTEFCVEELLYRGIIPTDAFISKDGQVHSAAFKCRRDEFGLSVDRQGERTPDEALDFAKKHLSNGPIVTITVQNVYDCGAVAVYDPIEGNKDNSQNLFHTQIYKNLECERLTNGQSKSLSKIARLVYDPR